MPCLMRPWGHMHFSDHGPRHAVPVVFANSLGTDTRMWDDVSWRLPGLRRIAFDKRGHGLSATPPGPWTVEDLAADVIALMDHLGLDRAVIAGCSIGGQIAQVLAADHPDRVSALVLSNTGAKLGTAESWADRISAVQTGGIGSIAETILERWFAPAFLSSDEVRPWRSLLLGCDPAGYVETCAALSRADLRGRVGRIAVPVVMIAGGQDRASPPAVVHGTAAMIPGARVVDLPESGHIPAIDAPETVAALIADVARGLE